MMKRRIRNTIFMLTFGVLALPVPQSLSAQEKAVTIEGLLYLDHSPVSIEIREGKIVKVTRLEEIPANFPKIYIAPGLIDNQVNGYAGVSFAFGGSDLTEEGVIKATETLWKEGVTTYLPTLTTNHRDVLVRNFRVLSGMKNNPAV